MRYGYERVIENEREGGQKGEGGGRSGWLTKLWIIKWKRQVFATNRPFKRRIHTYQNFFVRF